MRRVFATAAALVVCAACNCGGPSGADAGTGGGRSTEGSAGGSAAGGGLSTGGGSAGGGVSTGGGSASGGGSGGGGSAIDGGSDAGSSAGPDYNCHSFTEPSGWLTRVGFRSVVVASADAGLNQPVSVAFGGAAFDGGVFIVNQGNGTVTRLDATLSQASVFVGAFSPAPQLLTAVTVDADQVFDGQLYVADQGTDADGDSRVYRVTPAGNASLFTQGPGPGLDDIFAMVFTPKNLGWPAGLLVAGDTDRGGAHWGLIDADAGVTAFSTVPGIEGACVDPTQQWGTAVLAASPAGGGYSGTDAIVRLLPDGGSLPPIASGLAGVHGVVVAPAGPFNGMTVAASWASNTLFSITADGGTEELASGMSLTNYDANILAFSPNGTVLLVADRLNNRVVCIEPRVE